MGSRVAHARRRGSAVRISAGHLEAVLAEWPVVHVEIAASFESEEEHAARQVPPARRRLPGTRSTGVGINTSQACTRQHPYARTSSSSCSLRSSRA